MTPRDRRALVLGGVAVALAALLFRAGPWGWHAFTESKEALRYGAERLTWMRERLAGASRMEDSGRVVRSRIAVLAPSLLSGASAAEATADLGSRVTLAAERAHVGVSRTDVLEDSTTAGVARRVSLRAALLSDTRGLLVLLGALARGPGAAVVDEIQVAADPAVEPGRAEVLHTEIVVRGWYLPTGRQR